MKQDRPRKRPGPQPKGFHRVNIFLPPDLVAWGKTQEEGLSGLIRRLLHEEKQRRESDKPRS